MVRFLNLLMLEVVLGMWDGFFLCCIVYTLEL